MKGTNRGILILFLVTASIAVAETLPQSIAVDCSKGQSLNNTLSTLSRHTPHTVTISGTCTEYVQVTGFESLTLQGLTGAMLVQPATVAGDRVGLLTIESSRSVNVEGLSIQAGTTAVAAVAIGHGSSDIRLRHLNIQGGTIGVSVFEQSQVSIAYVTAQDPGFSTLGVFDMSDVHLERSAFTNSTGAGYNVGLFAGVSHITMYDTAITNMQVGIEGYASVVDVLVFTTYYANAVSTDVTISNPAGTNYNGVALSGGGSLNVTGAKLVITKPGQSYGGTSGGVLISDNAALNAANGDLVIKGSNGQGIIARNNSHATMIGATITGGAHGGLVAANLSSIDVSAGTLSMVGGNSIDLFCDPGSTITGAANISGVPISQCTNLLAGETVTLP